ncbi:MAG: hypothetical protein ACLR8Y_12145 [Alistipes indistinctus]
MPNDKTAAAQAPATAEKTAGAAPDTAATTAKTAPATTPPQLRREAQRSPEPAGAPQP